MLLVMSLAYSHFISPTAALGSNLGSAINPVVEGGHRDNPASYRLPVGNLLNRLIGVALFAPFLQPIAYALGAVQPDVAKMTAEFHVGFNVVLAVVFIGLLDPLSWLSNAAPVGSPWMWTLIFPHHEGRTPTHGYVETREAAMAAFAKSWRRE